MKNILIVESLNDKFFVEAMIQHLQVQDTEVAKTFLLSIDEYEAMEGLNPTKLENALQNIRGQARKPSKTGETISKIGIILDRDDKTELERFQLINEAVQKVFATTQTLTAINQFITVTIDELIELQIACYFTQVEGAGELETVLKAIKNHDSTYADCLNAWQKCLEKCGKEHLKQKDFDKFWIQIYIRYDTCKGKEKKQAGTKCNNEAAMQKQIWDFQHACLADFRTFLLLFKKVSS